MAGLLTKTILRLNPAQHAWLLVGLVAVAGAGVACSGTSDPLPAEGGTGGSGSGGTGGSFVSDGGSSGTSCGPDCNDPFEDDVTSSTLSTTVSNTMTSSTSVGGSGTGGDAGGAAVSVGGSTGEPGYGGSGGSSNVGSAGAAGEPNEVEPTAMSICPDGEASSCPSSDPLCAERTGGGTAATNGGTVYSMSTNYTFCTHFCDSVAQCHIDTGDATAAQKCGSFDGSDNVCYLDCSLGRSCPEGFECRGNVCMYKHCTCSGDCEGRTCY